MFAGGRSPYDPDLNTREFVLAGVARDLIKTHGWLLAFDEVQLVDIAGAGLVARGNLECASNCPRCAHISNSQSCPGTGDLAVLSLVLQIGFLKTCTIQECSATRSILS